MLDLILVSKSPRRREILQVAGFLFRVDTMEVSEIIDENINPEAAAMHIAQTKIEALLESNKYLKSQNYLLLSADTIVVLGDQILGKPKSQAEAVEFLSKLSDKTHSVITGVCLHNAATNERYLGSETTFVRFRPLSQAEIKSYVATGEPMDKAGAYGIQGEAKKFVQEFKGSYLNVVGLPLEHLERVLKEKNWHVHRNTTANHTR